MAEMTFLMEAANGMLVSVPESKLDAWLKAQENPQPLTKQQEALKLKILQDIYGPEE